MQGETNRNPDPKTRAWTYGAFLFGSAFWNSGIELVGCGVGGHDTLHTRLIHTYYETIYIPRGDGYTPNSSPYILLPSHRPRTAYLDTIATA
ncbi:uncharacterized protein LAJ45_06377 [Morchella importuna]|uniref:uncharacterized protein n=1 Tax=Morchella importuna TaxID=1174673 RepID=UPI001E8EB9EF|nr:uncharacterized protein LAJ45_06377 [Morchella importuna]KAH8149746.1 hypothetical protein LAJ45_06377 [Morchella importuna]